MNQADARKRLFSKDRPTIRPLEIVTDSGEFGRDMAVLWAAYRKGSFPNSQEMDQEAFTTHTLSYFTQFEFAWIVEDRNAKYSDQYGPVGMVAANYDGWTLEPHWIPFTWSTHRNRLRTLVVFMQWARYKKDLGLVLIKAEEKHKRAFDHISERYGSINYIGEIPHGDIGRDLHLYYGRGGQFYKGMH
jgi:hypothetical protein